MEMIRKTAEASVPLGLSRHQRAAWLGVFAMDGAGASHEVPGTATENTMGGGGPKTENEIVSSRGFTGQTPLGFTGLESL